MTSPRSEFDRRLQLLNDQVADVFGMVAADLPRATRALLEDRDDASAELARREEAIDASYPELVDGACREILLQAPVAGDLRFLLSVLRIVPELERSHDLIMQIADAAEAVHGADLPEGQRAAAAEMGGLAARMWREAADSWARRSTGTVAAAAESAVQEEHRMRELHASLTEQIASGSLPAPIIMKMTTVARCYDRLGAHAVNITRQLNRSFVRAA
jgi:phosphate transport system protein